MDLEEHTLETAGERCEECRAKLTEQELRAVLESLREADIVRRPTSLLYVQALKFLETTAIPPAARRARRERRVRRATRKA